MENFKKIEKNKKSNIGGGEWGQLGEDKVIIFKLKKKRLKKKKIKFNDWKNKKKIKEEVSENNGFD